mgnify:CR=1 FL=1
MSDRTLIRLDIGSGTAPREGFSTVDPYVESADYHDYMWNLLSFSNDSVDEIFSSHALEHIPQKMVMPTLLEWKRVLRPGGTITLRVPDLEWCCRHWLANQNTGWDLAVLFGHQSGEAAEGEFHKTGFSEKILKMYCFTCGFKITKFERLWTHNQETLSIELTK